MTARIIVSRNKRTGSARARVLPVRVSYVFRISAVMVSGSFSAKVMSVKFGNRFDFVMMIHPFVIYFLHSPKNIFLEVF